MGPIGGPEAAFIFFLALMLFGPKKLPELGRTIGKALSSFQQAKRELTEAFERETKHLALDTEMLTNLANQYRGEVYQSSYGSELPVSSASHTSFAGGGEPIAQFMSPEIAPALGARSAPNV